MALPESNCDRATASIPPLNTSAIQALHSKDNPINAVVSKLKTMPKALGKPKYRKHQ